MHLIQSVFLSACNMQIIFLSAGNIKKENKSKFFLVELTILKYEHQIMTSAKMGKNKSEKEQ